MLGWFRATISPASHNSWRNGKHRSAVPVLGGHFLGMKEAKLVFVFSLGFD
jgi:hypothetical protein